MPGPTLLGRSVIVTGGMVAPEPWAACDRIVVDDAALTDPATTVAALHDAWATRTPVVIDLRVDPARFRQPTSHSDELWQLGADFQTWHDRLHFLVWNNSYDARADGDEPIWWWARKAARLGAAPSDVADVVLADGTHAWVDGGPRAPLALEGTVVVHHESVDLGQLRVQPAPVPSTAELAPDQLAAVTHGAGPARVIAPAGSGKTRVLTERYRHLLTDRGYEPESVVALAYNKRAQEEMAARLPGLRTRIQTLNAWGARILERALGYRPTLLDERDVRNIVEKLVPQQQRRVNTDPLAPYIDGLSVIRLGLRAPEEVEASLDDVDGLAGAYKQFRDILRSRRAIDFDEQIFGALEAMVRDGDLRRAVQAEHRHLLVDEFQDLTPAHLLLVRLAAGPQADVFGVGDDDQTVYGHAGADPRFLVDYAEFFPHAGEHALEVNYRCPAAVTTAAAALLSYNDVRVQKTITPGPSADPSPEALVVKRHASESGAAELVATVQGWLAAGAAPSEVAVLTRTQSLLLAPHVALAEAGVAVDSILTERVLDRLGVRAALAYLRLAVAPDGFSSSDLVEIYRRPSRGLPQSATKWLQHCSSVTDIRRAAAKIDDDKLGAKFDALASDVQLLCDLARRRATVRELLTVVRDDIGLGRAMNLLDSSSGATGSHLDDLEGLLQVADLHPDASTFGAWLQGAFHRERADGGVTLSTIHRVKGQEWDHVAVYGMTDGLMPHRLADDEEEERRILHVAMTRGRQHVVLFADQQRRSVFLGELDGSASRRPARPPRAADDALPDAWKPSGRGSAASPKAAPAKPAGVVAEVGLFVRLGGGYEGTITSLADDGAQVSVGTSKMFVRFGERVQVDGAFVALTKPPSPHAIAAEAALREWRTQRAKKAALPAYIVFNDAALADMAARHPTTLEELRKCHGVGPAKLEAYGDEILEVLAGVVI